MNTTFRFLSHTIRGVLAATALAASAAMGAQSPAAAAPAPAAPGNYRLSVQDRVEIQVFEEAALSTIQRIDADGQIRLGLIGTIVLAGRSVREAEQMIEKLYVEQRFLRQPMVTVRVNEYAPREALINGAVGSPGPFIFPPEAIAVDIVTVITKSGGFTPVAKKGAVRVTRFTEKGKDTRFVDVEAMMRGRSNERFNVLPGDIIVVDEVAF